MNKWMFYLETENGARIEWRGLSQSTATTMYNITLEHLRITHSYKEQHPRCFGCEKIKEVD